jgi:hypothetical protein
VSVSVGPRLVVRTRSADPALAFRLAAGDYVVRTDGVIEGLRTGSVEREPSLLERLSHAEPALLMLRSDAPERHVVDGIAVIPADGLSSCGIVVQKASAQGMALDGGEHCEEVFIRTTGGRILDDTGARTIRSVHLQRGRASFRLVSEATPKVVTVSVLSTNPLTSNGSLAVEFA